MIMLVQFEINLEMDLEDTDKVVKVLILKKRLLDRLVVIVRFIYYKSLIEDVFDLLEKEINEKIYI